MTTPERHTVTVEISVPAGQTLADTVDWINRFFAFFHPRLGAVVSGKKAPKPAEGEQPAGADLLS